ncbi:MAG: hypothetical protein K5930_07800 [Treponemataceae bacterium]|nr:hypothetical protein [Treponemataceae bacterium]
MRNLKFVFLLVLCSSIYSLHSLSYDDAWKSLDSARMKFEEGNVGLALKDAENAKEIRKNESTSAINALENALKPLAVQEVGDFIPDVEEILTERMENDALMYIHKLTDLYGNEFFNNSITNIKDFYKNRTNYPEADYLIAKIYMQEGEYSAAADFYEKALENSSVLDVPDERYDILYDAAELARLQKKEDIFESYLLQVLRNNTDFVNNDRYTPYLNAIISYSLKEKSINQFFLLYRSSHYKSLNALLKLTDYYLSKNENDRAYYTGVLSVLTSFTRIYEILISRNNKYAYTTLNSFFSEALKYRDIKEWMTDNSVWKGFYDFGKLLFYKGNPILGEQMFEALKDVCPDKNITNLINIFKY